MEFHGMLRVPLVIMMAYAIEGRNLPTAKYNQVMVNPSSWTAATTIMINNMGECGRHCDETYGCKAFAYDSISKSCELGPLPNLPADADPSGKSILMYEAPSDCRSAQAISEGYQLQGMKYYKVGSTAVDHSSAVTECQAAGGRLAIFNAREDFEAVHSIPNVPTTYTFYWVGATVPAEKGATTCDTAANTGDVCAGFFEWDDGTPLTWTDTDIQDWATHIQRKQAHEFCAMLFNGKFDDGPCSGWSYARPICEIDCSLQ